MPGVVVNAECFFLRAGLECDWDVCVGVLVSLSAVVNAATPRDAVMAPVSVHAEREDVPVVLLHVTGEECVMELQRYGELV